MADVGELAARHDYGSLNGIDWAPLENPPSLNLNPYTTVSTQVGRWEKHTEYSRHSAQFFLASETPIGPLVWPITFPRNARGSANMDLPVRVGAQSFPYRHPNFRSVR